jgi:hypothetical protein
LTRPTTHPAPLAQREFAAALLDPARVAPPGLRAWNGSDVAARLAVHRNNVLMSLVQALAEAFPVVQRLVGDEFFRAMAGVFVRAHPPRSPVLAEYGEGFADWLAAFEPAASLPYLPDMARLERACLRAYHAADVAPLAAGTIARHLAAPEQLAQARLRLHPSVCAIASDWSVISLWAAHQLASDDAVAHVATDRAEAALVLRDGDAVLVLPAARAQAAFVHALEARQPLGLAIEAATLSAASGEPFDLIAALSLFIRHGALTHWHSTGDPE